MRLKAGDVGGRGHLANLRLSATSGWTFPLQVNPTKRRHGPGHPRMQKGGRGWASEAVPRTKSGQQKTKKVDKKPGTWSPRRKERRLHGPGGVPSAKLTKESIKGMKIKTLQEGAPPKRLRLQTGWKTRGIFGTNRKETVLNWNTNQQAALYPWSPRQKGGDGLSGQISNEREGVFYTKSRSKGAGKITFRNNGSFKGQSRPVFQAGKKLNTWEKNYESGFLGKKVELGAESRRRPTLPKKTFGVQTRGKLKVPPMRWGSWGSRKTGNPT